MNHKEPLLTKVSTFHVWDGLVAYYLAIEIYIASLKDNYSEVVLIQLSQRVKSSEDYKKN